uniref:Uncharacterized protein n=1 Tax=candidate division CPR3 bacterium TaxID=2268181 RepID=A0A7C4LZS9_UNCC3
MEKKKRSIKELDNIELILFGLRSIWRFWDRGGISCGRSILTSLLEPAIRLLSFYEKSYIHFEEFDPISRLEISQEILNRKPMPYQLSLPIFLENTSYFDRFELSYFLLVSLLDNINKDIICRSNKQEGFFKERDLVESTIFLMNIDKKTEEFDFIYLISAADDIFYLENRECFFMSSETDL